MTLTFDQLRAANVTRCEGAFHPIESWSPCDWMTALAGEVGEAANMIKKRRRGDVPGPDIVELADELADVQIYLDLLAARLDIDLGEATRRKFNIVSEKRGSDIRL